MSMPGYINHYYRDDKELPYEDWMRLFKIDLDKENESRTWDIRSTVWTDYGNGRDCNLNGHMYKSRIDYSYDKAKDLLNDMLFQGKHTILLNAIEFLTEEEAEMLIRHIDKVKKNERGFILEGGDVDY